MKKFVSLLILSLSFNVMAENILPKKCQRFLERTEKSITPQLAQEIIKEYKLDEKSAAYLFFLARNVNKHYGLKDDLSEEKFLIHEVERTNSYKIRGKAWAKILTVMSATAFAAAKVNTALPDDYQFLSYLIAQVSMLGVIAWGSPIWDPAYAESRKNAWSYSIKNKWQKLVNEKLGLNSMYEKMQAYFSYNEQMSLNSLNQYLLLLDQRLEAIDISLRKFDNQKAVLQTSYALIRLIEDFPQIPPRHPRIKFAFVSYLDLSEEVKKFYAQSAEQIIAKNTNNPEVLETAIDTLKFWLED